MSERIKVGGGNYVKWDTAGQTLTGEWRGLSEGQGKEGKSTWIGTVETEAGPVRFSATTVLQTKLKRIKEGFPIWITFLGEVKGKNYRYKDFDVEVESEEALIGGEETPF